MSARTKARKRALDVLFSADIRRESIADALDAERLRARDQPARRSSWPYAEQIVLGVDEHRDEIDELITTYAQGWSVERMPAVDRAIVRIAIWELLHNPDVPPSVAIAEAVESATVLSTDDSSSFVNGLLGRIATSLGR